MKVRIDKQTKPNGDVMHYIYKDDILMDCKIKLLEAEKLALLLFEDGKTITETIWEMEVEND
jgi:hypothetical protein